DLYLNTLGNLRGTANQFSLPLGVDPQTGIDRGPVTFATAPLPVPQTNEGPEWLIRLDHYHSAAHRVSARYIYESRLNSPDMVQFPGFILDNGDRNQNFQFTDSYTFGATYTNEFRFSYAQLNVDQARISSQSVPLARTLPRLRILDLGSPGADNSPEFHDVNNLLFEETHTRLAGRHAFRFGVEVLRQLATQRPNAYPLGEIFYRSSPGYSALANFIDDFSGFSSTITKTISASIFHP